MKKKKTKEQRKMDREIVERYHQKLTEDALEPLYENFIQWKSYILSLCLTNVVFEISTYLIPCAA